MNSCRMNVVFVNQIIEQLKRQPNSIRMLALSRANINDITLKHLADIISSSSSLIELDISWNNVKKASRLAFIKELEYNQRLQYLNLSYITMSDLSKQGEKALKYFISKNKSLLHLDLSALSLPRGSVLELAHGIRRSPSLLSVHLSGNGIKGALLNQVRSIVKVQRMLEAEQEAAKVIRDKQKELEKETRLQQESGAGTERGIADRIELKKVKQGQYENELQINETERNVDRLLLARKLLHPEIRGTDRWEEVRECWVCCRHAYSMVSFTKERAKRHANRTSV